MNHLTTAAEMARRCRECADRHFETDPDLWLWFTDAADEYAAMDADTIVPTF